MHLWILCIIPDHAGPSRLQYERIIPDIRFISAAYICIAVSCLQVVTDLPVCWDLKYLILILETCLISSAETFTLGMGFDGNFPGENVAMIPMQ